LLQTMDHEDDIDPNEWNIYMPFIGDAGDDAGFRIKNQPLEMERSHITGYDRKPGDTAVLGRLYHVVHGYMRNGKGRPATIIVFEWLLRPGRLGRRFREVQITVVFAARDLRRGMLPSDDLTEYDPAVTKVGPTVPLLSSEITYMVDRKTGARLGFSIGFGGNASISPEVSSETTESGIQRIDYMVQAGYPFYAHRSSGDPDGVHWTFQENVKQQSGLPRVIGTAVLLQRSEDDFGPFEATFKTTSNVSIMVDAAEIFSATPHRPSRENGWLSPLLGVVESCFYGRKGPWLPRVLDRLAIQHEELAKRFATLSVKFRVISYYEAQGSHGAALSKHCATLGIQQEEAVAIPAQRQLGFLKPHDLDCLNRSLLHSKIAHSQDFNDFIRLLSFEVPVGTIRSPPLATHVNVAYHLLSLPEVKTWATSRSCPDTLLRLKLGKTINPGEAFDSLAVALRRSEGHYHPSILIIGEILRSAPGTEIGVLASLIRQLLHQQPRLYSRVEPFFSLLHDAVLSRDLRWKQRVFWRCLETLIYAPKDTDTFLFIHIGTCAAQANILRLITSAAEKTEIPLHIAVSVEEIPDCPQDLGSANLLDIDLLSETFEKSRSRDVVSQVDTLAKHQPAVLPARLAIADKLQASRDHSHSGLFLRSLRYSLINPTPESIQKSWMDCAKPESHVLMIRRIIEDQGPWVAVALFWILHSVRPMSAEELDVLIAFEASREENPGAHSFAERGSATSLPVLLPGLVDNVGGKVVIYQAPSKIDELLEQTIINLVSHIKFPGIYLAEICLLFLMDHLLEGPFKKSTPKSKGILKEESQLGIPWTDQAVSQAASSLAKYAAEHWITHYNLANHRPTLDNKVFNEFVKEKTSAVKGWIKLLIDSSGIPGVFYVKDTDDVFRVLGLRDPGQVDSFQVLEFSSYACSRPSTTGLLDRFLVHGAELGDQDFVRELCAHAGKERGFFVEGAVVRAIAAAPEPLSQYLIQQLLDNTTSPKMSDVYLTAFQLKNFDMMNNAFTALKTQALPSPLGKYVTTVMSIACEHDDEHTVTEILNNRKLSDALLDEANKDSANWNPMHVAVTKGHVEMVSRLLGIGMSTETKTPEGQSPLMLATMHGFSQVASVLVGKMAVIDARDTSERTALHFASQHGFLSIARLLVSNEADPMASDDQWDTPIHLAIRYSHSDIATLLVKRHLPKLDEIIEDLDEDNNPFYSLVPGCTDLWVSPFDKANSKGATVLLEATEKDFADIVEILIRDAHAHPGAQNSSGMTPLHYAAKNGAVGLMPSILEPCDTINTLNDDECTPLHLACYYGQTDAVKELLKSAPDLSMLDNDIRNPLMAACSVDELGVVRTLLPCYEEESTKGKGVVEAVRYSQKEIVEYLLDSGCSPDAVDSYSNTPLHWAAYNANYSLVQLLLSRRCQLDPVDSGGSTPLCDAARNGADECARLLVNTGANMDFETALGRTPLELAIYWERPRLVQLLLEKGAKMTLAPYRDYYDSVLEFALRLSTEQVVRVIMEFYKQGKGEDELTPTKALSLVHKDNPDLLQPLLETWPATVKCVNEIVDDNMGTGLHLLALFGGVESLKLVPGGLERNAVNRVSGRYGTVLQAAICGGGNTLEKVSLLLQHDADPSIPGGLHGTALNAAAYCQQYEIVKMLLEKLPKDTNRQQYMCIAGDNGSPIQATIKGSLNASSSDEALVELLDHLRNNGAPLSMVGPYDENLLHAVATRKGSEEIIKWLREKGVSADEPDVAGRRPMHLAIHAGDLGIVKQLFTKETTLKSVDNQERNGLHYAVISKSLSMTNWLMDLYRGEDDNDNDASALVNATDVDMWMPLHWACRKPHLEIVRYLIEQGADNKAKTKERWTPWHVAIFHNTKHQDYLNLLPEPPVHELAGLPMESGAIHSARCDICFCLCQAKL
ncbi:MAG: hypothetical protein Q9163_004972, partial [Psora crenata]